MTLQESKLLFCIGGVKPEKWARFSKGGEWAIRGMVYIWRGKQKPNPDNVNDPLLIVSRPSLGPEIEVRKSEFIPIDEVEEFFDLEG